MNQPALSRAEFGRNLRVPYDHAFTSLTPEQVLFLCNFIKETAFYVEQLESHLGEYLNQFWEEREYAYQLTTDMLVDIIENTSLN